MAKKLTIKWAECWLNRLRSEDPNAYRKLAKILRKYQKDEDEHECYFKICHLLLGHG